MNETNTLNDLPNDIHFIIKSRYCKLFFDLLIACSKNEEVLETKKVFLDTSKFLKVIYDKETPSLWQNIYDNINKSQEDNISILAYNYCHSKAKKYYHDCLKKTNNRLAAQSEVKQFIYLVKLNYLRNVESSFSKTLKSTYIDKFRLFSNYNTNKSNSIKSNYTDINSNDNGTGKGRGKSKQIASIDDNSVQLNIKNIPGFLTTSDHKEYLANLVDEASTKTFNLLTNLYFENKDYNLELKDHERFNIFNGKYMKTYWVNKEEIGRFKKYNTDPKSSEFQQMIISAAKTKDYFKTENFFINGSLSIELQNQINAHKIEAKHQKLLEERNYLLQLERLKKLEKEEAANSSGRGSRRSIILRKSCNLSKNSNSNRKRGSEFEVHHINLNSLNKKIDNNPNEYNYNNNSNNFNNISNNNSSNFNDYKLCSSPNITDYKLEVKQENKQEIKKEDKLDYIKKHKLNLVNLTNLIDVNEVNENKNDKSFTLVKGNKDPSSNIKKTSEVINTTKDATIRSIKSKKRFKLKNIEATNTKEKENGIIYSKLIKEKSNKSKITLTAKLKSTKSLALNTNCKISLKKVDSESVSVGKLNEKSLQISNMSTRDRNENISLKPVSSLFFNQVAKTETNIKNKKSLKLIKLKVSKDSFNEYYSDRNKQSEFEIHSTSTGIGKHTLSNINEDTYGVDNKFNKNNYSKDNNLTEQNLSQKTISKDLNLKYGIKINKSKVKLIHNRINNYITEHLLNDKDFYFTEENK